MKNTDLKIPISFNQLINAVKQLSPTDKLKLSNTIWDSDLSIPLHHQNKVLTRIEKAKKNPARLKKWTAVVKDL
jgi:hypothetical protein